MKSLGTQVSEAKLTASQQQDLKSAFVTEILALREEYYIPLALMFNMDETAYQIAPPIPKNWRCSDGKPHADAEKYSRIFRRHPFTTLLCCVSASLEYLPPQINWKGKTDRLKVNHDKVQEYVQHTHWSTVESIFHYVETNLVPRTRLAEKDARGRSPKFMLILDYYGVHVSAEFRRRFRERFGEYGMLVFVPPNMTSTLQPLDVAVFGPFKAQAKKQHITELVEGAFQHTFAKNPRAFEFSTHQSRKACVSAIATAWAEVAKEGKRQNSYLRTVWDSVAPSSVVGGVNACIRVISDNAERTARGYRRPRRGESVITLPFGHPVTGPLPEIPSKKKEEMHEDEMIHIDKQLNVINDSDSDDSDNEHEATSYEYASPACNIPALLKVSRDSPADLDAAVSPRNESDNPSSDTI